MSILVVGSVALDTVETPRGRVEDVLGGSATYFSLAASLYTPVRLVAVVGEDFPNLGRTVLKERDVDLRGLEVRDGRTFRWAGRYGEDLNTAETIETQLNVFAHFDPKIPDDFRHTPLVFLANIDPELQLRVLSAVGEPRLTAMDTMNFWIASKRDAVTEVMKAVDIVFLNDAEVRQYARVSNLVDAAERVLALGPRAVVIKKGDNGCALVTRDGYFVAPAYPVRTVCDPTGAGDSFAGAFVGHLASEFIRVDGFPESALRRAVLHGCAVASYTVESFSVERVRALKRAEV
ncbi:MAG TPA: PfkB family carbohydrate kinase, partial [Chloroflexota bacterium]|nr:PfkB family carbohydrate kinase [Chloroflexota bacterium]